MSNIIEVENLSKKYLIGHQNKGKKTFREFISLKIANLGSKFIHPFSKKISDKIPFETFWALKNINFEVKKGDRIGIIGRNGAGKSTLLKVLSRITEPTEGKIKIKGRVACLLEVGTGFNSELTGRENIFLNGAILGMRRAEIKQKFDEIVDFSGVEKFLDTPVKRYSSGMYVRLAFAVAAHLEPEILIVDEVLAVGDAEFQKKCLGKMQDVSQKEGRTVLFVSHNMAAIQSLCSRAIMLELGKKIVDSKPEEVIDYYLNSSISLDKFVNLSERNDRKGNNKVKCINFYITDVNNNEVNSIKSGESYIFKLVVFNNTSTSFENLVCSFSIHDEYENTIILVRSTFTNHKLTIKPGENSINCIINDLPLALGKYHFTLFVSNADMEVFDLIGNVNYVEVEGGDYFKTGSIGLPNHCKTLTRAIWYI